MDLCGIHLNICTTPSLKLIGLESTSALACWSMRVCLVYTDTEDRIVLLIVVTN